MLGDFLKKIAAGEAQELSLPEVKQLTPGTAVVLIKNPDDLLNGGLSSEMLFAIRDDMCPDYVICQYPPSPYEWNDPLFQIIRYDVAEMKGWRFFRYGDEINEAPSETLKRAKACLGKDNKHLRSWVGDDFVDECIRGYTIEEIFSQYHDCAGQHWWTPLQVSWGFIREQLEKALENAPDKKESARIFKRLASLVSDEVKLPMVEHHGIVIERAEIIHFSELRIRWGRFDAFIETTPNSPFGGPAGGVSAQSDVKERLATRNRAVWVWQCEALKPGYWGEYNLFTNNCEHFCRACWENRRISIQVVNKTIEVFPAPFSNLVNTLLPDEKKCAVESRHVSLADFRKILNDK